MDKFDNLIGANSGFRGQELVDFNRGTSKAAAKGSLAGLVTASFAVGGAGVVRVGGTVLKALAAPTPFNPGRRAMLQVAASAPLILGSPTVRRVVQNLPRAKNLLRPGNPLGPRDVAMRYPGHVLGTPIGTTKDTISHILKVQRGKGFEGARGHLLSRMEDAARAAKYKPFSHAIGPKPVPPPVPTNITPGLSTFSGFNRFPSPTGRPMNPGMMQRWLNSLNAPPKPPDFW